VLMSASLAPDRVTTWCLAEGIWHRVEEGPGAYAPA